MMRTKIQADLIRPFPLRDIEWRVGSTNAKKVQRETGDRYAKPTKGQVLAYIDARHVMHRLDAIFGPFWQCEYVNDLKGPVVCRIGLPVSALRADEMTPGMVDVDDYIWRSDGAGETDIEGDKGKMSDAFKRAAVRWGIGRYLYKLPAVWVDLENGYLPRGWVPSEVPAWATPEGFDERSGRPSLMDTANAVRSNFDSIAEIKRAMAAGDWDNAVEAWAELTAEDQNALYRASRSGGVWTPAEYQAFHSNEFNAAREALFMGNEAA